MAHSKLRIYAACLGINVFTSLIFLYVDPLFLKDYGRKHPEVTVLDPPDAIQHLRNRQSMLEGVADLNLSDCYGNS